MLETYMKSALIQAVENEDEDEVKRLIGAGADVHETDDQGRTALLCAVQNDININIIRDLVENGEAFVNAKDRYGRSSLFYAVTKSTDTASYLFEKAVFFNDSDVYSILSFFIDWSLSTKSHDSHPTIDEVLSLLEAKGLKPKKLAKSIVNILLCKSPLLSPSLTEIHRSKTLLPMFHLYGKRKSLLDILNKITKCNCFELYSKKESIEKILEMIEGKKTISAILDLLKKQSSDPNFADSYGNTALHYATCLPWMGVPQETVKEICRKLQSLGVPLDKKNHLGQTPLLFCLSGRIGHLEEEDKLPAMKTLVEVGEFLVKRGSRLEETTKDGESVFHLVIELFQESFEIANETIRQDVINEIIKLLQLFPPTKVGQVVRKGAGDLLNTPLHRLASLVLPKESDYTSFTTKYTFKELLKLILTHLINCGAVPNDRNKDEETPLHMCNTWSAVKLLIDEGANPNDVDSSKRPPLLVAASKNTFLRNPSHFYPDVQEDAYSFFSTAVENKLDLWTVVLIDKQEISLLGFLIKSENYILSKALVEFACNLKKNDKSQYIFISLLKAICKDKSANTHWKIELAEKLLSCAKKIKIHIVSESLFTVCCKTMISQLPLQQLAAREEPSLFCEIVKMLRSYGGKLSKNSDEKLRNECKEIDNILKTIPVKVLVPWTSISKTHKNVLDKVARRQKSYEIGDIVCHDPRETSAGSFSPCIDLFVGINKMNSKEVAIKRTPTQYTQEVTDIYAHLDCEQVIRYFLHFEDNNANFAYIVFELMEGNLDEYLKDGDAFDPSKGANLCEGVVKGVNYLHKHNIRHFQDHLKPTSIFYKTHPELCLKITDFDHTQPADGTFPTYVWSSPEVLKKPEIPAKPPSDMFSCGLLQHYILSKGKHPFSPAGCTDQSKIVSQTKLNIRNDKSKVDNSLPPEAVDLTESMLKNNSGIRPTAEEALRHPLFWSKKTKVNFLNAVGNQSEFGCPRARRSTGLTPIETDLERNGSTIVVHGTWDDSNYMDMPPIYSEMTYHTWVRSYDTHSIVELVRFIRNAYSHVSEATRPTPFKKLLLEDFVFLDYFPRLVMEVYKVVTDYGWDRTRHEVKYAMKK